MKIKDAWVGQLRVMVETDDGRSWRSLATYRDEGAVLSAVLVVLKERTRDRDFNQDGWEPVKEEIWS